MALGRIYSEQGDLVAARKLSREAEELVLLNEEIYRPSNSRLRVLERESARAAMPKALEEAFASFLPTKRFG